MATNPATSKADFIQLLNDLKETYVTDFEVVKICNYVLTIETTTETSAGLARNQAFSAYLIDPLEAPFDPVGPGEA